MLQIESLIQLSNERQQQQEEQQQRGARQQRAGAPGAAKVSSEELQRLSGLVLALLQQMPGTMAPRFVKDLLGFLGGIFNWMTAQR